ncbi:MAG: hypothetical protein Kow00121_01870 [Elainellaceae cyanobacterium]
MAEVFKYVSEQDIDYGNLWHLLKAQRWQEANEETLLKLLEASGRLESLARSRQLIGQDISILKLLNLSSQHKVLKALLESGQLTHKDIHTIQQLPEMLQPPTRKDRQSLISGWQARGWHLTVRDIEHFPCADLQTIDRLWGQYSNGRFGFSAQQQVWRQVEGKVEAFGNRVGWRGNNAWIDYDSATFTLEAPNGHLPMMPLIGWWCWVHGLQTVLKRLGHCGIPTNGSYLSSSEEPEAWLPLAPQDGIIDVFSDTADNDF